MKRESDPADLDIVCLAESFNTPGNEITPGSDVIRKQFKAYLVIHGIHYSEFEIDQKSGGPWGLGPRTEERVKD
jgi:hypothetical protein